MLSRLEAGTRPEELQAARARVTAFDAQVAVLEKAIRDAEVVSPVAGIVTQKLVDAGELVARGTPLVVVTDLDHAWANLFVPEPTVPRIALGQGATVLTDAGGQGIPGKVTFISPAIEMGQGTFTSLPMLAAEELDVALDQVSVEHSPASDQLYGNPAVFNAQITGGSMSLPWLQGRRLL